LPKRIDPSALPEIVGTYYPSPYDKVCRGRARRRLGDAAGLTQYGVNLTRLPAGTWSSQRHWHSHADEFVYVVSGELVLVTDDGEETLGPGDAAGFKGGEENGHCLQNRSANDAVFLEIGARLAEDAGHYSEADLAAPAGGKPTLFTARDGTPFENLRRRGPDDD